MEDDDLLELVPDKLSVLLGLRVCNFTQAVLLYVYIYVRTIIVLLAHTFYQA